MDIDLHEATLFAQSVARQAGAELLRRRATITVNTKTSSTDLVTDADHEAERIIVDAITATRVGDGILGEEGASKQSENGLEWVIDPLDGTTNYVLGIPAYAVSLGLRFEGEPIVGVVYNPALDELYVASLSSGTQLEDGKYGTSTLVIQPTRALTRSIIATGFAYSADLRRVQGAVIADLLPRVADIRRMGSAALDLCSVARGQVDGYVERNVKPWDITAGIVIAREAGALVHVEPDANGEGSLLICGTPLVFEELRTWVLAHPQTRTVTNRRA